MTKRYHFISGLPRSGSTLLSSILKQNPKFTAGISDPLQMYASSIITDTNSAAGMASVVDINKRRTLIRGLFDSYYNDGNPVCFNTNRGWSAVTPLLADLFPNFKMIVCLREVPWILDSFEQLNSKNPYTIKPLYHHQQLDTVYDRTHMLMGNVSNFAGYVAGPLANVKQSMFSNERNHICYVEYETLVNHPESTLKQLYKFLGETWYEHDFDNVEDSHDEFDKQAMIEGLHKVRRKVEYKQRDTILPDELWQQYSTSSFWLNNFSQMKQNLNWVTNSNMPSSSVKKIIPTLNKQL